MASMMHVFAGLLIDDKLLCNTLRQVREYFRNSYIEW